MQDTIGSLVCRRCSHLPFRDICASAASIAQVRIIVARSLLYRPTAASLLHYRWLPLQV